MGQVSWACSEATAARASGVTCFPSPPDLACGLLGPTDSRSGPFLRPLATHKDPTARQDSFQGRVTGLWQELAHLAIRG